MKLAIITGTRPELIRLSKIINEAKKYYDVTHIYTNQNFDASLSTQFFKEFNIQPDYILQYEEGKLVHGLYFISECMSELQYYFNTNKHPDAVLILGDTNSAFVAASIVKRLGIPIFHMEAGNRCYDEKRVPEEINRYQIDSIADWHLCYTQRAREQLLLEGKRPDRCIVIGNPIYEVIKDSVKFINSEEKEDYILATIHRKENINEPLRLRRIFNQLNMIGKKIKLSAHPSLMSKMTSEFKENLKNTNIELFTPSNFNDFINLESNASCVITDSGTIPEECSILGIPCVLLRFSTERPELLENDSVVVCSNEYEIKTAIKIAIELDNFVKNPNEYHDHVCNNVIKLLMRYY